MGVHVKLLDYTDGTERCLLGRDVEEFIRCLPTHCDSPNTTRESVLGGLPLSDETLVDVLSYLDPDSPRDEWLKYIAGIRSAPIPDDPNEERRREIAHRFSRGALDRLHRYDLSLPSRYTGPDAVDRAFDSMPPKKGGVTVATPIGAARAAGFTGDVGGNFSTQTFARQVEDDAPVPFRDVLTRHVPPVQELVQGLVERGIPTFFSAPGGSHKSRIAVQWGLSIDTGTPIYGRAVERATFVYVSAEDNADEVARRSQIIAWRLQLPADGRGQFWDRVGKDSALAVLSEGGGCELTQFHRELCDHLRSIVGHKFVVLDSTYNFVRFQGKGKIDEGAVNAFIALLQRLCVDTDSTLLVLWHPSQAGQERGDASGWSVAWHNAPRARISITPVKNTDDAFELRVEKRNHGPKGKPLALYWSDGVLLPRGDTDTAEQSARFMDACVRVATAAAEQGLPIRKQNRLDKWMLDEVEAAAGYRPPEREVKDALARAMRDGRLRYIHGGNRRSAGFYPFDMDLAVELAIAAKRKAKEKENS